MMLTEFIARLQDLSEEELARITSTAEELVRVREGLKSRHAFQDELRSAR